MEELAGCPVCGHENPPEHAYCSDCGARLVLVCPVCGFESSLDCKFCGKCGTPLEDRLTESELDHLRIYLPLPLVERLQFASQPLSTELLELCVTHLAKLAQVTCTHLPAYLAEQIVHAPVPGQTGGRFLEGTLLFADLDGFVALSERLNRIGEGGAAEITQIVNRYFGSMLRVLSDHRGYLIKFGGDALLGLFLEPGSAARAMQATLLMQSAMAEFACIETTQGEFALRVQIGVRKGRFFSAQLGTPGQMECALLGADVNAAVAAESAAEAGQVLVDRQTRDAIDVPCRAVPAPQDDRYLVIEEIEPYVPVAESPFRTLDFPSVPTLYGLRQAVVLLDALTPYLPAGLLSTIAGDPGNIRLVGERRLVAVLFAGVHGLGEIVDRLGPGHKDRILAALDHYYVGAQDAVRRYGGVINKIDVSDVGDKLLAFFGAPVALQEDVECAVRAAIEMRDAMDSLNRSLADIAGLPNLRLSQRIAISYGYVFAGYAGTRWRHEYTVMGDEVNLAARLLSETEPGGITVSSYIRHKVQGVFDFASHREVIVKGKAEPVPIFTVSGVRAVPESVRGLRGMHSPIVGRKAQWDQWLQAFDRLLSGRGQVVSVTGEAGLGKSRLVAEMRLHATQTDEPGACWIEGHCLSYTESESYRPFIEAIRQMAGMKPGDTKVESWNKLHSAVEALVPPDRVPQVLPYLARFVGLPIEGSDEMRYLDAEALQRQTFIAIRMFVEAYASSVRTSNAVYAEFARGPFVLVLEDIHWIDQASVSLLTYLLPLVNRVPLMLLLLYRPERTGRCWEVHQKVDREFAHCATVIALQPLSAFDSRQLLDNLIQIERWPAPVRDLIVDRAEGNPLYLEEILRALIDDEVLARDDCGTWRVADGPGPVGVPDTLQGVILARIDRLDPLCREIVDIAAVIGRDFSFDLLACLCPCDREQLDYAVVRLQQHDIVHETQRTPELLYTFKHAMVREACYGRLADHTRRPYHRQIAAYLEKERSIGRTEAERNYALIAHHAFIGHDWSRAFLYHRLVGQRDKARYANREAIEALGKALYSAEHIDAAETTSERGAVHQDLGELLTVTGEYDGAKVHLERARAMAAEQGDRVAEALSCRGMAYVDQYRGDLPAALRWAEQGLAVLEGVGTDVAEAAELLMIAGLVNARLGNRGAALEQSQRSMRIARQLDDVRVLARACNLLGYVSHMGGQVADAARYTEQALDLYREVQDVGGQATAHNQVANVYYYTGQWREAEEHYCQARAVFERIADQYHCITTDNNLGGIARDQGRLDEAQATFEGAIRALEQIEGSPWVLGTLHMNLAATLTRRNEIDAARQHLRVSQDLFEKSQARTSLPEVYRHWAVTELRAGDPPVAMGHAERALDLAREMQVRGEEGVICRVLGEILAAQGQLERARVHLVKSDSILGQVRDRYQWACAQFALARLYWIQGKPGKALVMLGRCTEAFQQLGAALDLQAAYSLRQEIDAFLSDERSEDDELPDAS